MGELSTTQISNMALKPQDINKNDREAFLYHYTNGRPNTIYVPVTDFLGWKGVKIKSPEHEYAMPAKAWTFAYRTVAAEKYEPDKGGAFIKKSESNVLLFDLDFLLESFEDAKSVITQKALGC